MLSELQSLNLKLYSKNHNKIFVLHLIVAPQLSSGWWHNYWTKTRQAGHADEQSEYSLMSMILTHSELGNSVVSEASKVVATYHRNGVIRCANYRNYSIWQ